MKKKFLCIALSAMILFPTLSVKAETCNHEWGEWHVFNASCGEDGYKHRTCTKCWEDQEIKIPATGQHVWENTWYISEEPSCFVNGEKYRYCSVCNKEQTAVAPAYGFHDWSEWKVDEKPTCGFKGSASRYCKRCDKEQQKDLPIDPNNHELNEYDWYEWDEPTALHSGEDRRTCSCGKITERRKTSKLKAKVKLQKTKLSLKKKKTYTLKIKSKTYGDKISKWKSSKPKIASVSSKGKIKAKKKGTTKITLYMKSGVKATCTVKVK